MHADQYFRIGLAVFFAATALAAPSWGCASEQRPRAVALDPSNPTASEAEPLRVGPLSPGNVAPKGNPKAGEGGKAGKAGEVVEAGKTGKAGKQPGTIYTCPMHPEVTSDKPGRCPKCGMNLVPREPEEGKK